MVRQRFLMGLQTLLIMGLLSIMGISHADDSGQFAELNRVEQSLSENLEKQKNLQATLKKTRDEEQQKELQTQLKTLKSQEKSLEDVFNKMVFGGINPQNFKTQEQTDNYNWQEELLVIVKPLFAELRSLTAKPREKDRLSYENSVLTERYKTLTNGLNALKEIPQDQLTPSAKKRVEQLSKQWGAHQQELLNQKNIIELQIKELESSDIPLEVRIKNALSSIFLGRGLILLLAVLAGATIVLIFGVGAKRLFMWFDKKRNRNWHKARSEAHKQVNTRLRFLWIIYSIVVYIAAMLAFLSVIYIQGDMVLFGLAVLVIFLGIISLRNYAPQYVSELKIFLNLGAVREGERIMYRGIPWVVTRLSFYCTCVNPLLENGRIRIALSEIAHLNSRPFNSEEDWFPTKVGDDIFLPNGKYAKVRRQTPEMVYLDSFFRETMIPTPEFYAMKVENLINGFYVSPTFGLDYCHTDLPVSTVATAFEEKVREKLTDIGVTEYLRSISVQVKRIIYGQAIEYAIIMEFDGACGGSYFRIERLVNHACLEVCQEHGWQLPRQQIAMSEGAQP
ncbi:hypothetical protein PE074_09370 [Wohlfahrtiimonas chitiniclastica]|uniref:hypothetical protein n=1 Tax=Wohlfahrtiimonas chitiniclastica TaxID=400946 RepID=UPI000AF3D3C0|nr:hypothetical protein [Wohlfahrtiimonas chitiniclastica]MDC7252919.1 hypothetical protein [Wohlfahrtiimonas chitiniclastica]WHR55286.1 hypothetical protein PE074_09370 [Wohlfahrtiimonas chitiniclastica]